MGTQILRGHLSSAASLLSEAPHLKVTLDSYGNRPEELLSAQTNSKDDVSLEWASLREKEGTQAPPTSAAEDEDDSHSGGWPSEEISFPGWPIRGEDENDDASSSTRLRCEFTEVQDTIHHYCTCYGRSLFFSLLIGSLL